ncbi:VOC family protein [Saccharothrix syringae]|nr:VOC family protein [Saccharothrix syringae]ARS01472.1 NcmQ [Saccharothrix syringae]
MISKVGSVAVPVSDQDEAERFFVDVLGFEKRTDVVIGTRRFLEVAPPGADTVIAPYTWVEHHDDRVGGFSRVVLECADVVAVQRELVARGVRFEVVPEEAGYAQFLDPFGNVFVLAPTPG